MTPAEAAAALDRTRDAALRLGAELFGEEWRLGMLGGVDPAFRPVEGSDAVICERCGAAVVDRDVHVAYHRALTATVNLSGAVAAKCLAMVASEVRPLL